MMYGYFSLIMIVDELSLLALVASFVGGGGRAFAGLHSPKEKADRRPRYRC